MRIVVLSSPYYPYMDPPVSCFKPFLVELAKSNQVDMVCLLSDIDINKDCTIDDINVHFINTHTNQLRRKATNNLRKGNASLFNRLLFQYTRIMRYLKIVFSPSPVDNSLIDAFTKRLDSIYRDNPQIDCLISISFPFEAHIAALRFHQQHPEIKWITYTTDPFGYNETNPIEYGKKGKAIKMEHEVYHSANYNIVTEELVTNLKEDYSVPENRIVPFPYLISNQFKNRATNQPKSASCMFAGTCYYHIRNPRVLFETFAKLPSLHLDMFVTGDRFCRKMFKQPHSSNICINNIVPKDKYLDLIEAYDILINVSNTVKLQAPSKLFELISSGKPIINFYYNEDAGYRAIEKYPLGLNVPYRNIDNCIPEEILKFTKEISGQRMEYDDVIKIFPNNLLNNQMNVLLKIIYC